MTRVCTPPPWSPVGSTPTVSSGSSTSPICLTWRRQTISYLKKPKWGLECQSLDQDNIKNAWEGVARSLIAVAFATAFRSLVERCKKCVRLGGKFVEKS
jgi:hypothetical protein